MMFFTPEPWVEPEVEIAIDRVTKAQNVLALRLESVLVGKIATSLIYFGNERPKFFSYMHVKKCDEMNPLFVEITCEGWNFDTCFQVPRS